MSLDERLAGVTRREVVRLAGAGAVAVAGGNVLAACGGAGATGVGGTGPATTTRSAGGPPTGGTPVRGGTLTLGFIGGAQAETIVPGHANLEADIFRCQQLYDNLFWLGPDEKPVPFLAESAEPNSDATVWTVQVRRGVTWHDGKPLTAQDVATGIQAWTDKNNFYATLANTLIDASGVRTRGAHTVEVPLKVPVADFPGFSAWFSYAITRPDIYKKGSKPVGTGPFKFQSFTPGQRSVFVANKDYWGLSGGPYVDKLVVNTTFSDDTARLNALVSGSLDIAAELPPALAKANASSGQIYLGAVAGADTSYFPCRVDLEPFKDPRVMQALKHLVNRPQMVESVFDGFAQQSNDLPCPGLPYYAGPDVFPIREYDPEKARSLLKAAGRQDLRLTLYTSAAAAGFTQAATAYAQQAAKGGVQIKVVNVDPSIYYTQQGPAGGYFSYPMFTSGPGGGSSVPSLTAYYLINEWSKSTTRETHFGDAQTDKLMFDAIGELDRAKAQDKWNTIQGAEYDRGGHITFGRADYLDGYAKRVRGIQTNRGGWINDFNITRVWLTS